MSKAKRNTLIYLAVGGMLTMILAMSLSNLVLAPGKALPMPQSLTASTAPAGALPGGNLLILAAQGMLAFALIALPVIILYSLLTPGGRRRLLVCAVLLAIVLFFANYLQSHRQMDDGNRSQQSGLNANASLFGSQSADGNGVPRFPANPPSWIVVAIILAASIVVAAGALWAVRLARQRNQTPESALDQLAEQAQNAIDTLGTGGDLRQTVIRCYQEMNRVVREETGIARESAMTPREFEARLVSQGLPQEGVSTLTRLFEQVRYGSISADGREEALAVSCLTAIVNACKNIGVSA